jgi:hypothetical protein
METHAERSRKAGRPCTAHDLNFGGECFNCGFDPNAPHFNRCSHAECHVPATRIVGLNGKRAYTCGNHDADRPR